MLVRLAARCIAKPAAILCLAFIALAATAVAEKPPSQSMGDTWSHIAALPPSTRMHVAADKNGKTCYLVSSDDAKLTCSKGKDSSGDSYTFARADVKSVKLTRKGRSTLVGLLIGGGAGWGVGALVGHFKDPNHPGAILDFSGLSRDVDTGIGIGVGLVGGGVLGVTTDFLRGPTIYQRPGSK
jgi:hypothetical protein